MKNEELLYFTLGLIFCLGSNLSIRIAHIISLCSIYTFLILTIPNLKLDLFKIVTLPEFNIGSGIISLEYVFMRNRNTFLFILLQKLGVLICISGLAGSFYSVFYKQKFLKKEKENIFTGPYSIVRHPDFLGFFIFVLGAELYLNALVSVFLTLFFMFTKIRERIIEEENLLEVSEEYKEYKKKVPSGFFIK